MSSKLRVTFRGGQFYWRWDMITRSGGVKHILVGPYETLDAVWKVAQR